MPNPLRSTCCLVKKKVMPLIELITHTVGMGVSLKQTGVKYFRRVNIIGHTIEYIT